MLFILPLLRRIYTSSAAKARRVPLKKSPPLRVVFFAAALLR